MEQRKHEAQVVAQALGAGRNLDLSANDFFVLLLGPQIPESGKLRKPRKGAPLDVIGAYKRQAIRRDLTDRGYRVLTGEALINIVEETPDHHDHGLPANVVEGEAMRKAGAIVILPVSYGSCAEIGHLAGLLNKDLCSRTLVLQAAETEHGMAGQYAKTIDILGGTLEIIKQEDMRACEGLESARKFADRMRMQTRMLEARAN